MSKKTVIPHSINDFSLQDIADLKNRILDLEEQNERLIYAVEEAGIGYWDWNEDAQYGDMSPLLMKEWGIDPATYTHTLEEALEKIHDEDRERIAREIDMSIAGDLPYNVEYRVVQPSGNIIWVNAKGRAHKDQDGRPYRITGITINITERKTAEKNIRDAKNDAEKANRIKSTFLANMSHEIRTPLGAIMGFTELLREKNLSETERARFLETISRNGKSLTRIIDDILDLSKVEAGRLDVEFVDFSLFLLLDDVIEMFKERTRSKDLYLELNINSNVPKRICSDPIRLRQILVNIIGNAIKFTPHGGITISVSSRAENEWNYFEIDVMDTGIGLTQEQSKKLFEPFTQAESSTNRRFGGTGLGLALSRRLARALGGDIKIREQAQEGSVFSISFKAKEPAAHKNMLAEVSLQDFMPYLQGARILLAEDCPDNQFIIKSLLEKTGAQIDIAGNGIEVMRLALGNDYNLVLMDIQMPLMDGYEATRNLRKSGYTQPIIALTAHAMAEERALTRLAGCDGHLTKPLNNFELLKTVAHFIKKPTDSISVH